MIQNDQNTVRSVFKTTVKSARQNICILYILSLEQTVWFFFPEEYAINPSTRYQHFLAHYQSLKYIMTSYSLNVPYIALIINIIVLPMSKNHISGNEDKQDIGKDLHTLNYSSRWNWVVKFLHLTAKDRLVSLRNCVDVMAKRKKDHR